MKNILLLLLVATATEISAAALDYGDTVAADPGNDRIMPRSTRTYTSLVTELTTVPMVSLKLPTSPLLVVETAFVYETVWSNPARSTWTTIAATTELPATPSTSTEFTTIMMIATSVHLKTVTLRPRLPGGVSLSSPDAVDIPPYSSIITSVGTPLSTSSAAEETLPPPMLSAPVSSTITTVCDISLSIKSNFLQ